MSDSRSRAADTAEELEAYLAEHPHPYPVGTEIMRVSPYTGSAVPVTTTFTVLLAYGSYAHRVCVAGGSLAWDTTEFERVQPDQGDLAETEHPESMGCAVVQPDHYNRPGAPNCGDLIQALGLTYNVGTAQKYIYRAGIKTPNPMKDLRKAIQSLELEITQLRPMWDDDE